MRLNCINIAFVSRVTLRIGGERYELNACVANIISIISWNNASEVVSRDEEGHEYGVFISQSPTVTAPLKRSQVIYKQ